MNFANKLLWQIRFSPFLNNSLTKICLSVYIRMGMRQKMILWWGSTYLVFWSEEYFFVFITLTFIPSQNSKGLIWVVSLKIRLID